jgi:hypothetical protein
MELHMSIIAFANVAMCKKRIHLGLIVLVVFCSISSCEVNKVIKVSGVVVNKATQKPIDGVKVKFNDGIDVSGPIDFGGTAPQHSDSTFTDRNGKFKIALKTSSGGGFIYISKEGYNYSHPQGGGVYPVDEPGFENAFIEMDGIALFNPVLKKMSGTSLDDDNMIFILYILNSIEDDESNALSYSGQGPFLYLGDFIPNNSYPLDGDHFYRYKIKFTTNGIWHTKIDSVFLPTSLKVFRDTIYY